MPTSLPRVYMRTRLCKLRVKKRKRKKRKKADTYLYTTRKYSSACLYRSSCSMGLSKPMALNADFFQEVTMFQPIRPLVKWSSVEKRFASKNGCSNVVDEVIPKARFFVTAAIAVTGCRSGQKTNPTRQVEEERTIVGSVTGHCAALRMHSSTFPWYVS